MILTLLYNFYINQTLAKKIILQQTQIIYNTNHKKTTLPITNKNTKTPYLLQS